jgi:hypothetical protein
MPARSALVALLIAGGTTAWAQVPGRPNTARQIGGWQPTSANMAEGAVVQHAAPTQRGVQPAARIEDERPAGGAASLVPIRKVADRRKSIARVTSGAGTLPNEDGQVWREYDITPYTLRVTSTSRPEQAIVDWVLRETGYEAWHAEPFGILSASKNALRVYHTPEMQDVVAEVVDRFVNTEAESHAFSLRVITIDNPNWRTAAQKMMRPVNVQTQGVQAWLMEKEDCALLLAELRKRTDYREHSSPHLLVNNGQSTVVAATRPLSYIRDIIMRPNVWPGFETEAGQIDEGFSLELNPLLSIEGDMIDAVLKCNIDQVERLRPVTMAVPTPVAPRQTAKIEVPQVTHARLHERFRWPVNQVLLVGLGVVATPVPVERTPNVLAMALSIQQQAPRADLLVFVESKGKVGQSPVAVRTGKVENPHYRGRY